MSVSTPLYPNLQSSYNKGNTPRPSVTSADVRLSQSEEFANDQNEFVFINDYNQGDDGTANALDACEKWVLRPYRFLLLFLGWTEFGRGWKRVFRWIWIGLILFFIILTSVTQIFSCFRRDRMDPVKVIQENESTIKISCSNSVVSSYIILDVLIVISYIYCLYLFSKSETEYLLRLAENVFIKCYKFQRWPDPVPKYLIITVFIYIIGGICWVVLSLAVRILHAAAFHLFSQHVDMKWESGPHITHEVKLVLLIYSIFGFIFFDAVYVAAVVNYAVQSEMNIYLLQSIKIRVLSRKYASTDEAIKDIKLALDHIHELNSSTSTATALILFNLGASGLVALMKLDDCGQTVLQVMAAIFITILWGLMVVFPFIQASRVTSHCSKLVKSSSTIRARSMLYQELSTAELDSFIIYTSSIKMRAKMFGVPIYPWMMYTALVAFSFTMLVLCETGIYTIKGWF